MSECYPEINIPGHPLARANGNVRVHRAVLYDKIGPGKHPCRWCGKEVEWSARKQNTVNTLVVDHLDENIQNYSRENLVPSCIGCNALRKRGWRIRDGELCFVDKQGNQSRPKSAICGRCGAGFVHPNKGRTVKYCSSTCRWKAKYELSHVDRACPTCGNLFQCQKGSAAIYCSRKCGATGRHRSDDGAHWIHGAVEQKGLIQ